jgi:hypothetical protein
MNVRNAGRKERRSNQPAARVGTVAAALATAAGVAVCSAAPATALDVNIDQQLFTAGALANLLPTIIAEPLAIPVDLGIPGVNVTLTVTFDPIPTYDTQNIYNTINALPFQRRTIATVPTQNFDRELNLYGPTAGQFPVVLSTGFATADAVEAYRAQIGSVSDGVTPNGFTPFQPGPAGLTNTTNQALAWVRNPLRPNGGLDARFAGIAALLGIDTTIPGAGKYANVDGTIELNTATVDLTVAYDWLSDFPVTLNPFSLLNTAASVLPINLLGGIAGIEGVTNADGASDINALALNVAGVLGIVSRGADAVAEATIGIGTGTTGPVGTGQAWYGTVLPNDLPILAPMRLPVQLINAVFGSTLGTPLADALQPAAKILVNIGYSDVITPDDFFTCATKCGTPAAKTYAELGYGIYDRSFLTSATPEKFLSVQPLTPQEWLQVPGDVLRALAIGIGDVLNPPAPLNPTAAATIGPTTGLDAATNLVALANPTVPNAEVTKREAARPDSAPGEDPHPESAAIAPQQVQIGGGTPAVSVPFEPATVAEPADEVTPRRERGRPVAAPNFSEAAAPQVRGGAAVRAKSPSAPASKRGSKSAAG